MSGRVERRRCSSARLLYCAAVRQADRMQQDASTFRQLPLLERSWRAVVADGFEVESRAPVVVVALDFPTNHWPHHALSWLEDGFPVSADIAESLRSLHERRGITQRNRHRALRLVKAHLRSEARH